ncbi:MAG TPA: hypothetical protein VFQ53_17385 [Kofleriaceae bacterium]|nr:hypothetical protein [Kofleriaceae bacterium]
MAARVVALAIATLVVSRPAHAGDDDDYLRRLAATVRTRLDAIVASRAPRPKPPTPVVVTWKVVRLGSIDLGAPLVALTAANLDGDKVGELYAVTPREVVAIGFRNGKVVELGRVAFAGDRAVPAPRDDVGTAVVDGGELVAAVSGWAKELRIGWKNKQLVAQQGGAGFLVCPGERAQLEPGRNHFTNKTYGVRCRGDLLDREGQALKLRAELALTGKLAVSVERCTATGCQASGKQELSNVGAAFEVADIDRDGTPDVIVSEASAPGAPDSVKVYALGDAKKPRFKKTFNGGVAGLAVIDGDDPDDIPEVIAAVRLSGATRVDMWRLD